TVKQRRDTLEANITQEIAARRSKVSSKVLGLNQSVKEMDPLLAQVKSYKQDSNYKAAISTAPVGAAGSTTALYTRLMAEALAKSETESAEEEKLDKQKQQFNDRLMKTAIARANTALKKLQEQATAAKSAHLAKDINGLAAAKKAGAQAMAQINANVKPYQD